MQHLVSVSVIGSHDDMTDESLSSAVHQELTQWFGKKQTADWKMLKVYRVSFAQPNQVSLCHLNPFGICSTSLPFCSGTATGTATAETVVSSSNDSFCSAGKH